MSLHWIRPFRTCGFLTLALFLQAQPPRKPVGTPPVLENPNPLSAFRSFSGNVTGGIARDQDRKIYRLGKLVRLDYETGYRITDLETRQMWGVDGNHCLEFPNPDAGSFPFSAFQDFKANRVKTGEEEMVEGHACKIEEITLTPTEGIPLDVHMKLWEAEDLGGFPMRIEIERAGQKVTSSYRSVSLEPPDPKRFWHPAKCVSAGGLGERDPVAGGTPKASTAAASKSRTRVP